MLNEGSGSQGLKLILERHWDKLILASVGVAFVVFVGSRFPSGKETTAKRVDGAVAALQVKRQSPTQGIESPRAPAEVAILFPEMAFRAHEWTVGAPPKFEIITKPPPVAVGYYFPRLTLSEPQASVEGVKLQWSLSGEPDNGNKLHVVPPATFFYRIERRRKGEAEWTVLEPMQKSGTQYRDERTVPKTDYEYRVRLGSTDPVFGNANPSRLSDRVGGPFATRTPGIWEFHFSNISAGDEESNPPVPPTVYVKIVKYDPEAGKVEWVRIHQVASPLGFGDENGQVTSIHRVAAPKRNGKRIEVDFNSGAKILKIDANKTLAYKIRVCEPKIVGEAMKCVGPTEKTEHRRVHMVTYLDEEGKQQVFQAEAGSGPLPDRLCEDHGGGSK